MINEMADEGIVAAAVTYRYRTVHDRVARYALALRAEEWGERNCTVVFALSVTSVSTYNRIPLYSQYVTCASVQGAQ